MAISRTEAEDMTKTSDGLAACNICLEKNIKSWRKGFDGEFDENSEETVKQLKDEYEKIALHYRCNFLAASDSALPSPVDREHLDESGHEKLAFAVYEKVREILT